MYLVSMDTEIVRRSILEAVAKYDAPLAQLGGQPYRQRNAVEDLEVYGHLRWMCQQVKGFAEAGRFGKADRWLGFIQGALWRSGLESIDTFRKDNTRAGN